MFPEFPLLCLKEMVDFSGQKVTVKTISSEDKANFVSSTILDNALKQAKGTADLYVWLNFLERFGLQRHNSCWNYADCTPAYWCHLSAMSKWLVQLMYFLSEIIESHIQMLLFTFRRNTVFKKAVVMHIIKINRVI